ncbi:MAG: folate-binding protein YgfZ [Proteobacteria bacterium]|nr:folate-binding protein YgfZ [Pseudomonadota bacterium]
MMMPTTSASPENFEPALCPLTDMGVIEVTGDDAEGFLNGQLSHDVRSRLPLRATLSAWLDARGRVLALFRAIRTGDHWLLLTRGAEVEALIRRLRMFVLRADVQLCNQSSRWQAAAALGGIEPWLESRSIALGAGTGDVATANGALFIRVGPQLVYLVSAGEAPWDWTGGNPSGTEESAALEEIRLGLVNLSPQIAGRYTAHMLNLDRLGAVAFDKGCYPGQEVVARTENLGTVKRRVFRYSGELEHEPTVGTALLDSGGSQVGEVVRAVRVGESRVELLAVVRIDSATGNLTCAIEPGSALTRESLPGE